jgi:hypothetical protein
MGIGQYLAFDLIILYTIGFIGLLLLKKRFRLSIISFFLLFSFFNFNGHTVCHLTVGHPWSGIFFLPFFFLALLSLLLAETSSKAYLGIALSLLAMAMQGSFHLVIWCVWLIVVLTICDRSRSKLYLLSVVVFFGLAAYRILPSALTFAGMKSSYSDGPVSIANRELTGGFPTVATALASLIEIRDHVYQVCWCEFDTFITLLGLAFVLYFGLYRGLLAKSSGRFSALLPPVTILAILSLNFMYGCIAKLPLPLLNSESTTTRFLVIPVLTLVVVAVIKFQEWLDSTAISLPKKILLAACATEIFIELVIHLYQWTVGKLELPTEQPWWAWAEVPRAQIVSYPDPIYCWAVIAGCCISILTLIACFWLFFAKAGQQLHKLRLESIWKNR